MTEQRKSAVIALEKGHNFGKGELDTTHSGFYRFPAGYHISHSISTSGESVYETGNKIRVGATYGPISGQWKMSYMMDYDHLEPIAMVYDQVITIVGFSGGDAPTTYYDAYTEAHPDDPGDTPQYFRDNSTHSTAPFGCSYDSTTKLLTITDYTTGRTYNAYNVYNADTPTYIHIFIQRNNCRPAHYVVREKILHRMVNEDSSAGDEFTELWGAVPVGLQVQKSASSSEMQAAVDGLFADQRTVECNLDTTDWVTSRDSMTQQACMWIGTDETNGHFIEDVDSFSLTTHNQISFVKNICSRVPGAYAEGLNQFGWEATTYHNDVTKKFLRRVFSGGETGNESRPRRKGLAPLQLTKFMTFTGTAETNFNDRMAAYKASTESLMFVAKNSTLRNMTWPEGAGGLMKQSMSSVECDEMYVVAVNGRSMVWDDDDVVTSAAPNDPVEPVFKFSDYSHIITQTTVNNTPYDNVDEWTSSSKLTAKFKDKRVNNFIYKSFPQSETAISEVGVGEYIIVPYSAVYIESSGGQETSRCYLKDYLDGKLSPIPLSAKPVSSSSEGYNQSSLTDFTNGSHTGLTCAVETKSYTFNAAPSDTSPRNPDNKNCYLRIRGTPKYKGTDYYLLAEPATKLRQPGSASPTVEEMVTIKGFLRIDVV